MAEEKMSPRKASGKSRGKPAGLEPVDTDTAAASGLTPDDTTARGGVAPVDGGAAAEPAGESADAEDGAPNVPNATHEVGTTGKLGEDTETKSAAALGARPVSAAMRARPAGGGPDAHLGAGELVAVDTPVGPRAMSPEDAATALVEVAPAGMQRSGVSVPGIGLAPEVPAGILSPPVPVSAPPERPFIGGAANVTASHPHQDHLGFFDGATGEQLNLREVFEEVPGMATMTRTTRRVVERHRIPGSATATTDRLLFAQGVSVPASVAAAMVATAETVTQ